MLLGVDGALRRSAFLLLRCQRTHACDVPRVLCFIGLRHYQRIVANLEGDAPAAILDATRPVRVVIEDATAPQRIGEAGNLGRCWRALPKPSPANTAIAVEISAHIFASLFVGGAQDWPHAFLVLSMGSPVRFAASSRSSSFSFISAWLSSMDGTPS